MMQRWSEVAFWKGCVQRKAGLPNLQQERHRCGSDEVFVQLDLDSECPGGGREEKEKTERKPSTKNRLKINCK